MGESTPLGDTLRRYMDAKGYTIERLAKASGVSDATLERWLGGQSKKSRWKLVVKVAAALDLNKPQANTLLRSAGHGSLDDLLRRAGSDEDKAPLRQWTDSVPTNLPAPLTSVFGRHEELFRIVSLFEEHRLVTLTGSPGAGKTRLALEVAETVLGDFEGGVYVVELAPAREPEHVLPAVARELDVPASPGMPAAQALAAHLREKRVLLVLDNFEQVVDAAPLLVKLLEAAPEVRALVTSRTRLRVRGERPVEVRPLALPDPRAPFEELRASTAVALFADRASTGDHQLPLTPETAPLVAEICSRLDGLPLAIELAAARVGLIPLHALLRRFPTRLELASGGLRDLDERQRTLRDAIEWSHDLLGPEEERLFRRLGVFVGGCPEDAAAAVAALPEEPPIEATAALDALVEKSLLQRTVGVEEEPRYAMLESIREYALERLGESGELETARRAHAAYYLRLAEASEPEWDGPRQTYWLDRLELELPNFREALGWFRERGEVARGLRLSAMLMSLWQVHNHHPEGRAWLAAFATEDPEVPPELRARALVWRGLLHARYAGEFAAAEPLFEEALALYRRVGAPSQECETLQAMGESAMRQGAVRTARDRFAESLEAALRGADTYMAARARMKIAMCAQEQEDWEAAHHHWRQALSMYREAGSDVRAALALNGLGEVARLRRDPEAARLHYEDALAIARKVESEWCVAMSLQNLGYVVCSMGEHDRATELFIESLALHEKRQIRKGAAECLAGLAATAAAAGHAERAARLCGAAEAMLGSIGPYLEKPDRAEYERTLGTVRGALGERAEALLTEGRAFPPERAVAYATEG